MRPIETIPDDLLNRFSMNGEVDVVYKYRDDSSPEIQDQINANYTKEAFDRYRKMISHRKPLYYKQTDKLLYKALKNYDILGADVCVFGSAAPWYELMFVQHGAHQCDVYEFSDRESHDERISYCGHDMFKQYEIGVSISSFEHYGLGRYGDPIDPDGDLKAMWHAKKFIEDDGLMFLSVPVGKDAVYFNVHRVYGKKRLPILIDGWDVVDMIGFTKDWAERTDNGPKGTPYQPLIILRKP